MNTTHQTEVIWTAFSNQLKQFLLRRVADESLADDLLQDVFLKIHAHIDTLQDETKVESWIYQIARNTVIDYYRTQKTMVELSEILSQPDETESRAEEKILKGLKEMIEKLPEPYSQALLLTEFEGLTQKELAEKLGISVSGAKSRVQRARKMLKDDLMRCCHFELDRYGTIIDYYPITCCCCAANQPKESCSSLS